MTQNILFSVVGPIATITFNRLQAQTARLMQRLAQGATYAYGETKALMNQSIGASMKEQLEAEVQAFSRCARTADLAEGVVAFVEKRKPVFTGK